MGKGQQRHKYKEAGRRGLPPPRPLTATPWPDGPHPETAGTQDAGTSGGSKGLRSQNPGRISHPGRCHWGPGAGFSSRSLRTEGAHSAVWAAGHPSPGAP